MTPEELAKALQLTMKIREDSFHENHGRYRKSYLSAAHEACEQLGIKEEFAYPIYLLLDNAGGAIDDWARDTLAG